MLELLRHTRNPGFASALGHSHVYLGAKLDHDDPVYAASLGFLNEELYDRSSVRFESKGLEIRQEARLLSIRNDCHDHWGILEIPLNLIGYGCDLLAINLHGSEMVASCVKLVQRLIWSGFERAG